MDLTGEADEWFELYQKSKEGKLASYDQITEHIWLSGFQASEILEVLQDIMKVSAILTVADSLESVFPDKFKYKTIEIVDDEESDLFQHFKDCIAFMTEVVSQKQSILVHCAAGVSRSASVVIAYIMYTQKLKFKDAYEVVRSKRPCVRPNPGFIRQLELFEKHLIDEGVIAA